MSWIDGLPRIGKMDLKAKFEPSSGFYEELKRRVDARLIEAGSTARDRPGMYLKAGVILTWFALSYAALVFWASNPFQGLLCGFSLAVAMGGIGFSIAHDSNHGALSDRKWANALGALAYELLGASSFIWRWKHNILHHSFTNVSGFDSDIDSEPFLRLSPHQRRRWFHRFQVVYAWLLYAFLVAQWQFISDFRGIFQGRIGRQKFKAPRGREVSVFWGGKLFFLTWVFIVPALFHPFWMVLVAYAGVSAVLSVIMSIVFQVAHVSPESEFIRPIPGPGNTLGREWARHQAEATVDFARENRLLSWYLGGLNFQIEHHLFPKICHFNYPLIAPVVEETCAEFGVKYASIPTFTQALRAHAGWLHEMGRSCENEVMSAPSIPAT